MQPQPHFLFNTLNTIAEIVHDDADKADHMITSLSDLLRRALELGATQEISLDRELDLLARYLDIQKTLRRPPASQLACGGRGATGERSSSMLHRWSRTRFSTAFRHMPTPAASIS